MPNVIVEPDKKQGGFKATQNGHVVARAETQTETGLLAHERRPNDTVLAARVRHDEGVPSPDKFRHMYGPKR